MSDDNEIFRVYAIIIELYNALKFITMLFTIQKMLTFNLGVAFLKSVSICACHVEDGVLLANKDNARHEFLVWIIIVSCITFF